MTLNAHKALEQYFHQIVNKPPVKEPTMFDVLKAKWTEFWHTRYVFDAPPPPPSKAFLEFKAEMDKAKDELYSELKETLKPTPFVEEGPTLYEDGYWAFEMYTPEWVDSSGETIKPVHTCFITPHEGTWFEVLDTILDAMEKHYGYNIKEQVYYSVNFPLNDTDHEGKPFPGYGRCLNDERLQQILLAFPELYESGTWRTTPEKALFQ